MHKYAQNMHKYTIICYYHFYKKDKFRRINLFTYSKFINIKTKLKILVYILNYTVVNTTL
jgi:hypothetical protein